MQLTIAPSAGDAALTEEDAPSPLEGGRWYHAEEPGAGLDFRVTPGTLQRNRWLYADALLDGLDLATFRLTLHEAGDGRVFALRFGLLNQVGARMRLPLAALNQGCWQLGREGAYLKPTCGGDAVDPARVDRLRLEIAGMGDDGVRFCLGHLVVSAAEPVRVAVPSLPLGPVTDGLGQHAQRLWLTKSRSTEEVSARLQQQLLDAGRVIPPSGNSRWGGTEAVRFEATGCFRTQHDGRRWWLVDPDGGAFWSAGVNCVRPAVPACLTGMASSFAELPDRKGAYAAAYTTTGTGDGTTEFIDFLQVNLMRAFGASWEQEWGRIALAQMRRIGFNTEGNWSAWETARAAGMPYVRPLGQEAFATVPRLFRDFPDVFEPAFRKACRAYAEQLLPTRDDPAFIGYFLMHAPTWAFASTPPAEGMLLTAGDCAGRQNLEVWLREKYGTEDTLVGVWGAEATFDRILVGDWCADDLTAGAREDLAAFSGLMVERLYKGLSDACRDVDPNHLNLGARCHTIPPPWAMAGMRHFDVVTINCYRDRFPADEMTRLCAAVGVPVMIGAWHFGALDVGLPGASLRRVRDQHARGEAYRRYAEAAMSHPDCVGAHWFALYDESAAGRFDGENWNTGFFDLCHRPYDELIDAARRTHQRQYDLVRGVLEPYDAAVESLPVNTL